MIEIAALLAHPSLELRNPSKIAPAVGNLCSDQEDHHV